MLFETNVFDFVNFWLDSQSFIIQVFEVPVYGKDNRPLNVNQLHSQLEAVVKLGGTLGPPLGLFTMENRNSWAKVYKKMCKGK